MMVLHLIVFLCPSSLGFSSLPSHSSVPSEMNSEIDSSVLSTLPLVLPPIANFQPPMLPPIPSNNGQDPFAPPAMAPVVPMPVQSTVPGSPEQTQAGVTELIKEPQANTGCVFVCMYICVCTCTSILVCAVLNSVLEVICNELF